MTKAVLYVRVSSKEQAQEGYSIPAQRKFLQDYAEQNGLEIIREFEEVETAKRAGRSQFGEMLKFFKRNRKVTHLLVEKTDRLYRNFRDLIKIDDLALTIHFAKEGHQLSPSSRSGEKLVHNIKVAIAKNYVDNLGEETSKGMLEKARQGLWPSVAPLGYENNRESKLIQVDRDRAPIIRELFEAYATGGHSVQDLVPMAWDLGLRSRKGFKIHKAALHKMLLNPIYMGEFIWKGERYQGKHEPLVSREVWDEVQRVIHSRCRPRPHRLKFAFRGQLKCGHCGCSITGQIQKGKYVYYRCTRSRGNCQEMPIREEELAEQLGEPLKWLRLTSERLQWVVDALKESHEQEQAMTASEQERINHDVMIVRKKIDTLYEDRLMGRVPDEFWTRKFAEYQEEESRLLSRIERLQAAKGSTIEEGERILKLSQRAYSLYVSQNPDEQRKLVDILLSNCTLKDRRVSADLRKPFDVIADSVKQEEQLRRSKLPFSAANGNWLPRWGASANS